MEAFLSLLATLIAVDTNNLLNNCYSMVKIVMYVIIATWLYRTTYSDFVIAYDLDSVIGFVMSGEIIVSILYFAATIILIEYGIELFYSLLVWLICDKGIAKKIKKTEEEWHKAGMLGKLSRVYWIKQNKSNKSKEEIKEIINKGYCIKADRFITETIKMFILVVSLCHSTTFIIAGLSLLVLMVVARCYLYKAEKIHKLFANQTLL